MLSKVRMNREGIAPGEMSPSRKGEYCGVSLEVPRGVEFLETEGGRVGARQGQGRRGLGRRLRGQGGGGGGGTARPELCAGKTASAAHCSCAHFVTI